MTTKTVSGFNIAIIKLGSIGDVVHALPVLCGLKRQWPQSRISWLVEPKTQDVLLGHQDLEQVIVLDTKAWKRQLKSPAQFGMTWQAIHQARRQLQECKFDLALDLQGLIKSGLITMACGAKTRLGFHPRYCRESLAALFTNQWVRPGAETVHIIEQNLAFLRQLGLDSSRVEFKLPISAANRKWAGKWLKQQFPGGHHPLVVLNPGTSWQSKRWPIQNYIQLAKGLQERKIPVLLSGGPGEEDLVAKINSALPQPAIQAVGFSLSQFIALLEQIDLMIASDSGPLHLAAALGKSTVAFYGPSRLGPARSGPYGPGHTVFYPQLPCRGCHKRYCADLKCMQAITVQEVLDAVIRHLKD